MARKFGQSARPDDDAPKGKLPGPAKPAVCFGVARARVNGQTVRVEFDARRFLCDCSALTVAGLVRAGWSGRPAKAVVASLFAGSPALGQLAQMVRRRNVDPADWEFEATLDGPVTLAWLQRNRPALMADLREITKEPGDG